MVKVFACNVEGCEKQSEPTMFVHPIYISLVSFQHARDICIVSETWWLRFSPVMLQVVTNDNLSSDVCSPYAHFPSFKMSRDTYRHCFRDLMLRVFACNFEVVTNNDLNQ